MSEGLNKEDLCDEIYERRVDRELGKKMDRGYFTRQDGVMIFYEDIAQAIKTLHPELVGHHIFEQITALGLFDEFRNGQTPCSLPYSFTGC